MTGFEPARSALTGQRTNLLCYTTVKTTSLAWRGCQTPQPNDSTSPYSVTAPQPASRLWLWLVGFTTHTLPPTGEFVVWKLPEVSRSVNQGHAMRLTSSYNRPFRIWNLSVTCRQCLSDPVGRDSSSHKQEKLLGCLPWIRTTIAKSKALRPAVRREGTDSHPDNYRCQDHKWPGQAGLNS